MAKATRGLEAEDRREVAKHLMMLGNLAAGALVFGQTFSGFSFDLAVSVIGLVILLALYGSAVFIMRKKRR